VVARRERTSLFCARVALDTPARGRSSSPLGAGIETPMRLAAILLLALMTVTGHGAEDSDIGYPSPAAALAALKKNPDAQFSVMDGWTIVSTKENGNLVMWSFTPDGHPAHPAAVKRTMTRKDGAWYLDMKVLCGGTKAHCDKLVEDFKQLNERMTQYIREHHGT
jgi:hypothetical protein